MLAEMGIAVRDDSSLMGVYSPKKVFIKSSVVWSNFVVRLSLL